MEMEQLCKSTINLNSILQQINKPDAHEEPKSGEVIAKVTTIWPGERYGERFSKHTKTDNRWSDTK